LIHFINESIFGNSRPYNKPFTKLKTSFGPKEEVALLNNN